MDICNKDFRQKTISNFHAKYEVVSPLIIIVVTYNRLQYLKKCISSIIASTISPYRILVVDDGSTDGTVDWLKYQQKRGKIWKSIFSDGIGTANNFNAGLNQIDSEWGIIANDDMYFHRWWDVYSMHILCQFNDIGTLTFYDFTNNKVNLDEFDCCTQVTGTGLGAAFIRCSAWRRCGGFKLKSGARMGFFASRFCKEILKQGLFNFMSKPNFASHMDLPASLLSERDVLGDYIAKRKIWKKGATG